MRELAVSLGVPEDRILCDYEGFSTFESVSRARDVFHARRVLVITQKYHLHRAVYIARTLGMNACGVAADTRPYAHRIRREPGSPRLLQGLFCGGGERAQREINRRVNSPVRRKGACHDPERNRPRYRRTVPLPAGAFTTGLVSNMSGISPRHGWRSTVDVLPKLFTVSCLFASEHGVRGVLGPGEKVSDGRDELTGLYTHSLFEDMVFSPGTDGTDAAYAPRADSLRDADMLVFDMQDVGSRYFTYASTLLCTMRACAANRVPLCVLDRPNPLGGLVTEGGRQADDCVSFIGLMRMPIRHGPTLGELARYCNEAYALSCDRP